MCKLTKQMSNFHISSKICQENALFSGKIYGAGTGVHFLFDVLPS